MERRNSENKRERRCGENITDNQHYFGNFILSIISLLIVCSVGLYLKNTNLLGVQSTKTDNKINDEIKNLVQDRPTENIIKAPVEKEILISFAGDCSLGTDAKFSYDNSLPAAFISNGKKYSYFMQNVYSVFSKDDYTLVNLETTLTDSNTKTSKEGNVYYNFKGPREYVNILTSSSVEGVTIANNHIYDYGSQGFKDTVNTLKEKKVDICGEGYKIFRDIKGNKFGFLGYTGWQYSDELKAKIVKDINDLRSHGAEVIIPYFHWGIERVYEPNEVQQKLARFVIDNGADMVIGSHPHVIQSMENYKGKLIVYSMGDFCFGGNFNPSDKRTFILQLKVNIKDDKLINFQYKILPAMISSRDDKNDYIPTLAVGENKNNILKALNELSPSLNDTISDEFFYIN